MKTYKINPIIKIDDKYRTISMCAFWRQKPKDYHMSSGYLLEYKCKRTGFYEVLECLDDDHVWNTLETLGYNKQFRKLITNLC